MRLRVLLLVATAIGLSGCWFGKKNKSTPTLPPQPAAAQSAPSPAAPAEDKPEPAQAHKPSTPAQERRPPPPRATPQPAAPPVSASQAPAGPVQAAPPTPPRLGEILTDDQRRQYEADFTRSVGQARVALNRASGRALTGVQRETVERIRTFLEQAEASRTKDLVTALQLARRADLLAQDLLKSMP